MDILHQLKPLFKEVFSNASINISGDTVAKDIQGWDSLNNMILIAAIERHFAIKFTFNEMRNFKNVGNMVDCIEAHLLK
jgi:acyl carrier protein